MYSVRDRIMGCQQHPPNWCTARGILWREKKSFWPTDAFIRLGFSFYFLLRLCLGMEVVFRISTGTSTQSTHISHRTHPRRVRWSACGRKSVAKVFVEIKKIVICYVTAQHTARIHQKRLFAVAENQNEREKCSARCTRQKKNASGQNAELYVAPI